MKRSIGLGLVAFALSAIQPTIGDVDAESTEPIANEGSASVKAEDKPTRDEEASTSRDAKDATSPSSGGGEGGGGGFKSPRHGHEEAYKDPCHFDKPLPGCEEI